MRGEKRLKEIQGRLRTVLSQVAPVHAENYDIQYKPSEEMRDTRKPAYGLFLVLKANPKKCYEVLHVFESDIIKPIPPHLEKYYGGEAFSDRVAEGVERLNKSVRRSKPSKLEKTLGIVTGASFIFGLLFLSSNITGNIIGISNVSSNYFGIILMIIGLVSLFMYSRTRNEDEPTSTRVYNSRTALIKALKNLGWNSREVNTALQHEDAHFREAVKRGYKPKYCVGVDESIGANKYRAGIVLDREASREDLAAILSAPAELSSLDKKYLKSIKKKRR